MPRLRYAAVCASNQNRSMEVHALLKSKNYTVKSFGVGGHVKLPGSSANAPNIYPFGTPYKQILDDLRAKDVELYTRNGLLQPSFAGMTHVLAHGVMVNASSQEPAGEMLERNVTVKDHPERWQDNRDVFDVALTFDERVMEQLVEDMSQRKQTTMKPLLVVNIDVKDNHEEAAKVAPHALRLCELIEDSEDWEDNVDSIMEQFEAEAGRRPLYTICFY